MLRARTVLTLGLLASAAIAILLAPALAQNKADVNPYLLPDETWISIGGTAVSARPDSFTLDYGDGVITVEMDGWSWYEEARQFIEGHKVVVYGQIDDDLFETTTIDASSIFVEGLGGYFYAHAADPEYRDAYNYWIVHAPVVIGQTVARGTVTNVDVEGGEFTLDTGVRQLTVDTSTMDYNPLDDKGFQKIDKGDYVSVSGIMKSGFWTERELMADTIVTLYDD